MQVNLGQWRSLQWRSDGSTAAAAAGTIRIIDPGQLINFVLNSSAGHGPAPVIRQTIPHALLSGDVSWETITNRLKFPGHLGHSTSLSSSRYLNLLAFAIVRWRSEDSLLRQLLTRPNWRISP